MGIVKGDVAATTAVPVDGRRSRWDAHRVTRREELIDAAVRSVKRHGPEAGMDQIAADARTSKPVIYRYFTDKTDLYRAVTQRVVGTILAALRAATERAPGPQELITDSVDAYLALLEQSPQLYRFVVRHPHLEDGTTFSDVIAAMLAEQLAESLRADDLDPASAHPWGEAIVGFISAASLWWLDHPTAMTRPQLARYLVRAAVGRRRRGTELCGTARRRPARPGRLSAIGVDVSSAPETTRSAVPVDTLRRVLDGRWHAVRDEARELADDPRFAVTVGDDVETQRADVLSKLRALAGPQYSGRGFPAKYGGQDDVGGSVTAFEMLAFGDLSLLVKAGVQWGLFGGAILHLGTARHHDAYLADTVNAEVLGCFAMTETGHGSDVAHVRTTATYDPDSDEFVINTPDDDARKEYIGNAARDGHVAVVFAQLITGGEDQGVHAFVVPIRDGDGATLPGVRIEDCGLKAGLNGVDNGRLWFDSVRVPRDNLLDRYGSVAADGAYSTPIENQTKRFFTMLGTLVQGRISVAGGAGQRDQGRARRSPSATASERRQFAGAGRRGDPRPRLPRPPAQTAACVGTTYAMHFAQLELVAVLDETTPPLGAIADARRRAEDDPPA